MAKVKIKVKSTAGRYQVWLNGEELSFEKNQSEKDLADGKYLLSWFALGSSGRTVNITVSAGPEELAAVAGKIPASYGHAGGIKRFKVGA